jgi:large subunit ribosomal protein L4
MKAKIITLDNKAAGEVELPEDIFGLEVRKDILHRVVEWQRAKAQAGTHKTKQRGEIALSTRKPFKQKGTGSARQGSRKGPHMRKGYKAHGPVVRSHAYDLPKKVRKLGLKTALSFKQKEGSLTIIDTANINSPKTKELLAKFTALGFTNTLFIDGDAVNSNFSLALRNIMHVDALPTQGANVLDILKHKQLVLTKDAVEKLTARLA